MRFSAIGLPEGLELNQQTGRISGSLAAPGQFRVRLCAQNAYGSDECDFRIVVGEDIALTPPMGWNSWYGCSEAVSHEAIERTAKAMVSSGLADHGWTHINIDDCWQGDRGGTYQAIQGNERFPDMARLCHSVHDLGLKIGIYSTPWVGTYAGFIGGSCDNAQGNYSDKALPLSQRLQPHQIFGRYPGSMELGLNRVAPHWFGGADAKQWAEWGFDFVKYDWKPIDAENIDRIAQDLRTCGRDIILSLSNEATLGVAVDCSRLSQLWRTTGDIQDDWHLVARGFEHDAWAPFAGPGHWNDPDMLQVGSLGVPNSFVKETRPTRLTPDEQYSHFSLWCLLAAPLLLSCDLTQLDAFTLNLLCNDEVLAVNQDPLGVQATTRLKRDDFQVMLKAMEDGSLAVGVFNLAGDARDFMLSWDEIGLAGPFLVRDLWRQVDLDVDGDKISAHLQAHGVILVLLKACP